MRHMPVFHVGWKPEFTSSLHVEGSQVNAERLPDFPEQVVCHLREHGTS